MHLKDVAEALPRAYLAWPLEIAASMKAASGSWGRQILWENRTRGGDTAGAGTCGTLARRMEDDAGSTSKVS